MSRLPDVLFRAVAPFLGEYAPSLGRWAETCSSVCRSVRKCYCRHCGRVVRGSFDTDAITGRVSCASPCDYPDALDPFRHVYPHVEWDHVLAAGGWPAFLHFREHLRHDNPWRAGGPVSRRDLDLFWFNRPRDPAYCWINKFRPDRGGKYQEGGLCIHARLERPSEWDSELGRHNTETVANTKLQLTPVDSDGPVMTIDVIGACHYLPTAESVLATFDLPCCMVGFQGAAAARQWTLHPQHMAMHIHTSVERSDKLSTRLDAYLHRGYMQAKEGSPGCSCERPSRSSGKRRKQESPQMLVPRPPCSP